MKIVVATRNRTKSAQIRAFLALQGIEPMSLEEAGIDGCGEETGETLADNALIKARFAYEAHLAKRGCADPNCFFIGDDSGLFIKHLAGWPGVHTATCAGKNASPEDIRDLVLRKMAHLRIFDRAATFKTIIALVMPDGERKFFSGALEGTILESPQTSCQPDMPFNGVFVPAGQRGKYQRTLGQMTPEQEGRISHRGQALRALLEFLRTQPGALPS